MRRFILLVILVVALVARFRYITEIEHNVDHAYPVWQAMQTIDQGEFPLAGQGTSVLFANPALTGYLLIPAVALTRSPLGVYVFIIALNTLAVWMVYRAASAIIGRNLALIAAGLMAVNPWVIEYSRTSWVQSLMPFFVCGIAWLLWPVLMGQSQRPIRRTALALTLTALFTQTYLLAYFILAPVFVLLVIYRKQIPMRGLMIGGAVILLTSSLYGLGLLNQWDTVQERLSNFSTGESRLTTEAWDGAIRLVSGQDYEVARGTQAPADDTNQRHDLSRIAHIIVLGFTLVGLAGAVWKRNIILLAWFFLPILAMSYTSNPVHPFYMLLTLPAGYIFAAWGVGIIGERIIKNELHLVTGVLILSIPFAALMLTNSARYYQETNAIPSAHGLTALPVDVGLALGKALPTDGTVFAEVETEWILNSFAGELFPVVSDVRLPHFNYVPANGGAYVQLSDTEPPLPVFSTRTETITLADGNQFYIDELPPAAQVDIPGEQLNIPSQQGIKLVSYVLDEISDDTWRLMTVWHVDFVEPQVLERIFSPFFHVFDADNNMVHNLSGEGLPGFAWQVGDLHVHTVEFTWDGEFTILAGQFDGLHNANVVFLPPDEEPTVAVSVK